MWHVHSSSGTELLDHATLIAKLRDRSLDSNSLVWTEGLREWIPANQVFTIRFDADVKPMVSATAIPIKGMGLWWLFMFTIGLACAGLIGSANSEAIIQLLRQSIGHAASYYTFAAYSGIIALLAVLAALMTYRRARTERTPRAGVVSVLAIVSTALLLTNAVSYIISVEDIIDVSAAREIDDMETSITWSAIDTVRITGPIRNDLARDISALFDKHRSIRGVELESAGGLIDEALRIASFVSERRLRVVTVGRCYSACVAIAIASPESYALDRSEFGFHRASLIVPLRSSIMNYGAEEEARRFAKFLLLHHIPRRVLQEAEKHGQSSVYRVSARDMVSFGALRGLVGASPSPPRLSRPSS